MFIPEWVVSATVLLFVYLIATDIRLHRRVKKLERTVMKLEGIAEKHHSAKYEHIDLT